MDNFDPSNPTTDGKITLREAVEAANTNSAVGDAPAGSGADTINFAANLDNETITLDRAFLGAITVSDSHDLTIDAGALSKLTIDADDPTPNRTGTGIRIFAITDPTGGAAPSLVELIGLTLTGADEQDEGGAIFSNARLVVRDSIIVGNEADSGGGIFVEVAGGGPTARSVLTIDDSLIEGNSADAGAGIAVVSGTSSTPTSDAVRISNTTIKDNKASFGDGGGVYAQLFGAEMAIDDNTLLELNEAGDGGAVYARLSAGATLAIEAATIEQNDAGIGAGVHATIAGGSAVAIDQTTFNDNEATSNGGAVYATLSGTSSLDVTASSFVQNDAQSGGAAFVLVDSSSSVNFGQNTFDRNEASIHGGGVFLTGQGQPASVSVVDSTFVQNDAGSSSGRGGGLYVDLPGVTLSQLNFDANTAADGGGFYLEAVALTSVIDGTTFVNNDAARSGGGAFVDVTTSGSRVEFLNSVFTGNRANTTNDGSQHGGGGLFASIGENASVSVVDSVIADNDAIEGGGIRLAMPSSAGHTNATGAVFSMKQSLVEANRASSRGGGIYAAVGSGGLVSIEESVITGNDAGLTLTVTRGEIPNSGGGIYAYLFSDQEAATLTVARSEISGNVAGQHGGGIAVCTKRQELTSAISRVSVYNSTVSENQAGHTTPANDPGTGGGVHLGIFPHENEEALDAHFQNSTITGNNADSGGGIYAMVPDVNYPAARNRVWLTNSIASANQSHSSNDNNLFGSFDVNATVYNVIGSGNSIWSHSDTSRVMLPASPDPLDDGTNILTDAPLLSPLAWHGGPTKTHRLLLGSPAIDAGSNMLAVVPFTNMQTALTTDQRSVGFPRSWNTPGVDWVGRGPVDIGAYEIGLPKVIDVTVDGSTSFHDPYSFAEQKATGSGEQVRTVPVGGADMFHIQFSETMNPATFAVSDLEVIGLKTATKPVPVSSGFSVNSTADVATWTFSDWSLGDNYLLSLADQVFDQYGQALDGEWVNPKSLSAVNSSGNISTFPSGDNVAGGQFDFVTTLLPGDADLNGVVDVADLGTLSEHYNQHNMSMDAVFSQADFTGDGVVDVADLGELGTNWQVNLQQIWILADLGPNPDDRVDAADDAILQSNYGMTNPTREDGDLDADGDVDGDDLLILQQMMGIDLDLAV